MTLNCPICDIALSQHSIAGEMVEHCNLCGGSWHSPSELSSVLKTTVAFELFEQVTIDPPARIMCPKCDIAVSATNYAYDSGVPILKCRRCSGVWLVAGQLRKILEFRNGPDKTSRPGQANAATYVKSNALARIAELVQSRILSLLFAILILVVTLFFGAEFHAILRLLLFLILPITCIWHSDAIEKLSGIRMGLSRPTITQPTPGIAVAIGGWILLFAILFVVLSFRKF